MSSQLQGVKQNHSYTYQIKETADSIKDTYKEISTLCSGINDYILQPLQFLHGSLKIKLYLKDPTARNPFPAVPDGTVACSVVLIPQHIVGIAELFRRKNENWGIDIGEKVLQVISKIGDIALGIMSSFKLTDTAIALISYIAKEIGSGVAVAQTGITAISTLAPFTAVFTGIEMAKTVVDIGIDSLKMYRTSQKVNHIEQKITLWQGADWTNSQFASGRLAHLDAKQLTTEEQLEGTKGALDTAQVALESAVLKSHTRRLAVRAILDSKNKIDQVFGAIVPKIKLTIAEFKEERAREIFKNRQNIHTRLTEKHTLRTMKITSWNTIKIKIEAGLIGHQQDILDNYKERQIEKLKTKKSNLNLERVKIGLDIALKVVVVASLIATMVLLFSGVGTGIGVITAVSVMLFIMAAEYGLKKFKECYPSKTWQAFRAPAI